MRSQFHLWQAESLPSYICAFLVTVSAASINTEEPQQQSYLLLVLENPCLGSRSLSYVSSLDGHLLAKSLQNPGRVCFFKFLLLGMQLKEESTKSKSTWKCQKETYTITNQNTFSIAEKISDTRQTRWGPILAAPVNLITRNISTYSYGGGAGNQDFNLWTLAEEHNSVHSIPTL